MRRRWVDFGAFADPSASLCRWVKVDNVPNRYLLSDVYGKLLVVEIARSSSGRVAALQTRDLGDVSCSAIPRRGSLANVHIPQTASPTSLVFLSDTLLYLSSRFGDSQLIRLPPATLATSSSSKAAEAMDIEGGEHDGIQLVASFASLAPIIDCCVVAGEGGGAVSSTEADRAKHELTLVDRAEPRCHMLRSVQGWKSPSRQAGCRGEYGPTCLRRPLADSLSPAALGTRQPGNGGHPAPVVA